VSAVLPGPEFSEQIVVSAPIPTYAYVQFATYFVPVEVGAVRFKQLSDAMKTMFILCIVSVLDLSLELVLNRLGIHNLFMDDLFLPIEVSFLGAVFFLGVRSRKARTVIVGSALGFLVVWVIDKIYFDNPDSINSWMSMASRVVDTFMALVVCQFAVRDHGGTAVDPSIEWVAAGAIVYSVGTFLIFGLGNQLMELGVQYFTAAWYINWTLAIVSNVLFTKGLLCKPLPTT